MMTVQNVFRYWALAHVLFVLSQPVGSSSLRTAFANLDLAALLAAPAAFSSGYVFSLFQYLEGSSLMNRLEYAYGIGIPVQFSAPAARTASDPAEMAAREAARDTWYEDIHGRLLCLLFGLNMHTWTYGNPSVNTFNPGNAQASWPIRFFFTGNHYFGLFFGVRPFVTGSRAHHDMRSGSVFDPAADENSLSWGARVIRDFWASGVFPQMNGNI
jgi:hypothetical protein